MSTVPNELTEAELAAMSPNERRLYERLTAEVARDEAEAANEVPMYPSRAQAMDLKRIVRWAMLEAANPYTKARVPVAYERLSEIYDLIHAEMQRKGMG